MLTDNFSPPKNFVYYTRDSKQRIKKLNLHEKLSQPFEDQHNVKNVEVIFCPMLPIPERTLLCLKLSRLCPLLFLTKKQRSMWCKWNDSDSRRPKYLGKILSLCRHTFVQITSKISFRISQRTYFFTTRKTSETY